MTKGNFGVFEEAKYDVSTTQFPASSLDPTTSPEIFWKIFTLPGSVERGVLASNQSNTTTW